MTTIIKCWEVSEGAEPRELQVGGLRFEEHLENWLEHDITMLSSDLVVIGRQVDNIDLVAVDGEGRVVVIELKRDQVPREAIAQAVDYASLASAWPAAQITQMAEEYLSKAVTVPSLVKEMRRQTDPLLGWVFKRRPTG